MDTNNKLNPRDVKFELTGALTSQVIGIMLEAIQGDTKMPWNHAVYCVTLAIKSISSMAMELEGLGDDQVKALTVDAITSALLTDVTMQRVESEAELDELIAAQATAPKETRH